MSSRLKAVLSGYIKQAKSTWSLHSVLRTKSDENSLRPWERSLKDPTAYYLDCVRYFHSDQFPSFLKKHRAYFRAQRRGFGEDAFHAMWWMLFQELRPERFLEIGVYRGQTLSLASLIQRELSIGGSVVGISPFTCSGDAVSSYREDIGYLADTGRNFTFFGLPKPELVRSFSTDPAARARIEANTWDAIYIDGNHDYGVARSDWDLCAANVSPNGVIVLDDAALGTAYKPPVFATAGHPGPSRVAEEVAGTSFREIIRVGHNRVFQRTE